MTTPFAPTLYRLPPLPQAIPMLTTEQARLLDERYTAAHMTVVGCKTCKGTKRFRWLIDDGTEGEYVCPCRDQFILSRWLWHCGVLPRWQRMGWGDFVTLDKDAAKAAFGYLDRLDAYAEAGIGLTLTGPKGTGKTLLAHLILKEAIGKGRDCYATTFEMMIDEFAEGWRNHERGRWFNQRVRDAGLLFIDDLGRERNKGEGSLGEKMLETVVRHRTACLLPTIITTNLDHDQIGTAYGGHVVSLLSEVSTHIEVPGLDSRVVMAEREMDYISRGLTRPVRLS